MFLRSIALFHHTLKLALSIPLFNLARQWFVVLCWVILIGITTAGWTQELKPEDAEAFNKGNDHFQKGEFQQTVDLLEPLRKKYPSMADVPRLLSHSYYELGRVPESRQAALEAIGLGRFTPDAFIRLAQIDRQREDQLALLNTVRLLTILEPDNNDWRLLYGDVLEATQSYEQSASVYRLLIAEQPNRSELFVRLGNVLIKQDNPREAVKILETAWRLGDANPRLPEIMAGLWAKLDNDRQANCWSFWAVTTTTRETFNWPANFFVKPLIMVPPLNNICGSSLSA